MKWNVEMNQTKEGFPCLNRIFYTKFWRKLLQKDPKDQGKIHGQEIIDNIKQKIEVYNNKELTNAKYKI